MAALQTIQSRKETPTPQNVAFWTNRNRNYQARGTFWQADHIIPLVEANRQDLSLWSLSNLRLLCTPCHKRETATLAGRRASAHRPAPNPEATEV
jgi:5-methylcytosine-specific restriction endonuclease McrA